MMPYEQLKNNPKIITQYVYEGPSRRRRAKLGAILRKDGQIQLAWSAWHPKKDVYKKNGFDPALFGRLCVGTNKRPPVVVQKELLKFSERAKRYFKTDKFTESSLQALEFCLPKAVIVD